MKRKTTEAIKAALRAELDRQSEQPAPFTPYFDGDLPDGKWLIDGPIDPDALAEAVTKAMEAVSAG